MNEVDNAQVAAVVELLKSTLGSSVVAVYLYGSALMGGLQHRSDLDLLVIVDRPTTTEQRRALTTELMDISLAEGRSPAGRPVELTVVRTQTVAPWRGDPEREFQYGEWLRAEYAAGHIPGPEIDHDLAPLLATVLTASRAVVGPAADFVIDPIPHEHLVGSMRAAVPALMAELPTDTVNVLLTLARMWHTKEAGSIVSKDAAASWALERLPADLQRPLEAARAVYLDEQHYDFDGLPSAAEPTARFLRARIDQ